MKKYTPLAYFYVGFFLMQSMFAMESDLKQYPEINDTISVALAETLNAIAQLEKNFHSQLTQFKPVVDGVNSLAIVEVLAGRNTKVTYNDFPSNMPRIAPSDSYNKKIKELLAQYYSEEQINEIKIYSVKNLHKKIEHNQLDMISSIPDQSVRATISDLFSIESLPAILNSMYIFTGILCIDEKICDSLSEQEFQAQCYHMASRIIDLVNFKTEIINTLSRTGLFDTKDAQNYMLLLLKKHTLLTAQQLNTASLAHDVLLKMVEHYNNKFAKLDMDINITASNHATFNRWYTTLKNKILFYETEILPVLKKIADEQKK